MFSLCFSCSHYLHVLFLYLQWSWLTFHEYDSEFSLHNIKRMTQSKADFVFLFYMGGFLSCWIVKGHTLSDIFSRFFQPLIERKLQLGEKKKHGKESKTSCTKETNEQVCVSFIGRHWPMRRAVLPCVTWGQPPENQGCTSGTLCHKKVQPSRVQDQRNWNLSKINNAMKLDNTSPRKRGWAPRKLPFIHP